jgi:hypothetical protein
MSLIDSLESMAFCQISQILSSGGEKLIRESVTLLAGEQIKWWIVYKVQGWQFGY